MNRFERGLAALTGAPPARDPPKAENSVTVESLGIGTSLIRTDQDAAMKLSTVSRCIDILSDSIGKMPFFVYDRTTRERVEHPVGQLLELRPNRWQTPLAFKKQMEAERVANGNGIAWICRDPRTLAPTELVPIPRGYWQVQLQTDGELLYQIRHPFTGEELRCGRMDVLHVMAFSRNGYQGIGYLERASEIIRGAIAAQEYNANYYANGGQPAGILRTESDLSGTITVPTSDGSGTRVNSKKDRLREEW